MQTFETTVDFINNHVNANGFPVGTIIYTEGYSAKGGVGRGRWRATGNVITASQDPLALNDIKLSDASGNEYELVLDQAGIIDLNCLGGTSAAYINIATAAGYQYSQGLSPVVPQNDIVNIDTIASLQARAGVSVGEAFMVSDKANGIFRAIVTGTTLNVDLPDDIYIYQSTSDPTKSFKLDISEGIYLPHLGSVGDSTGAGVGTDNSAVYQKAYDLQVITGQPISEGPGRFRITNALTYTTTNTDTETSTGLVYIGAGMNKTFLQNDVVGTMLFIENSTGSSFAKGNRLSGFSVIGKGVSGVPDQVAIRHQATWYNSYQNVRIVKVNGTGIQSGDSAAVDPDATASVQFKIDTCELDENVYGFDNPQNNNSPLVLFLNTSIRNNSRGGIKSNSSYVQAKNCSISFNGLIDASNATGGVDVNQQAGSVFSDGYRTKGFIIDSTELDTNYPWNVRCLQAENPEIRNCSTQFRDYPGIPWATYGITTFPDSQFIFGGSLTAQKCFEANFENNRVSIVSNGNLALNPTDHAIIDIGDNGLGTNVSKIMFQLDFAGGGGALNSGFHIIREPQKTGSNDNRKNYVEYDYPTAGMSTTDILNGYTQCFYKKIFPGFSAQNADSMHYAFTIATDSFKQIPVPQLASDVTAGTNYNMLAVTFGGNIANSALIMIRAAGGPGAAVMTNGSTNIDVTTGPLTGTTGGVGRYTISADTDGTVYIENRSGSLQNLQCSWLMAPGIVNQV